MIDQTTTHNFPKWLVPVGAVTGLVGVILFALGFLGGGAKIPPGNTPALGQMIADNTATLTIARQTTQAVLPWQGTVKSRLAVKIAPKINARILEIAVQVGDKVKKGTVLARLDNRDAQAGEQSAQSALLAAQALSAEAQAEENRIIDLYKKQAVTRQNYDTVIAQAKAARARANQAASAVQQSQVMLAENTLFAPFDGIVAERLQEPGDMGVPNQPLLTVLKPDDLRLEASIASACVGQLKLNKSVSVRIDGVPPTLTGTIDEIAPETDPQTRTQLIKIRLPYQPGLQPGQFGWVDLACAPNPSEPSQALLIPLSALVHYGQLQAVKLVDGKQWHIRHIRTGKVYGQQVEVLSGLHEGEIIILNGGLQP